MLFSLFGTIILVITYKFSEGACPSGSFGKECEYRCQCAGGAACDASTAKCPQGCEPGWMGEGCFYRNIAQGKTATQSSTYSAAERALDGDNKTPWGEGTCTHTNGGPNEWWTVDLGAEYSVEYLIIYNRKYYETRLEKFKVYVGNNKDDFTANYICHADTRKNPGEIIPIRCSASYPGQYVTIQITGNNRLLSLCEVEIYGGANVATQKPAEQISTWGGSLSIAGVYGTYTFGANLAVDGDTNSNFLDGSCIHTKASDSPWWKVDLQKQYKILWVNIYNRADSSTLRLRDFIMNVYPSPGDEPTLVYTDATSAPGVVVPVTFTPLMGQVVEIRVPGRVDMMHICEVQVFTECDDGFYGMTCEDTCNCMNANDVCDKHLGSCRKGCAAGFKGIDCQEQCSLGRFGGDCAGVCNKTCVKGECNTVSGICTKGCIPGYTGNYCENMCPEGMYGQSCAQQCSQDCSMGLCHHIDASCSSGCVAGFKGAYCNETCSIGMHGKDCAEQCNVQCVNRLCDRITGKCTTGCNAGYEGDSCNKECPDGLFGENCMSVCNNTCMDRKCHNVNGICSLGCAPGWKGAFCDKVCLQGNYGPGCTDTCSAKCAGNGTCDIINGTCAAGCVEGWHIPTCKTKCPNGTFGDNCSKQCSDRCFEKKCDHIIGNCTEGCAAGWVGQNCSTKCGDGYYGPDCNYTCSVYCVDSRCNNMNGTCDFCQPGDTGHFCNETCPKGTYGPRCSEKCSMYCMGKNCNVENGKCLTSCLPGWIGAMCNEPCPKTKYGQDCTKTCSEKCFEQDCFAGNGNCKNCPAGWQGNGCTKACDGNSYGQNCVNDCSENCKVKKCHPVNGTCIVGCIPGFQGTFCAQTAQTPSDDDETPVPVIIGVVVGILILVIIVIIIVIIILRRRKNKKEGKDYVKHRDSFRKITYHTDTNSAVYQNNLNKEKVDNISVENNVKQNNEDGIENVGYIDNDKVERAVPLPMLGSFVSTLTIPVDPNDLGIAPITATRVKVEDLWDYAKKKKADEKGFKTEFESLKTGFQSSYDGAKRHMDKNRYTGIYPYDNSRVKLITEADGETDYYNASYIDGYMQPKTYIAAQGPTDNIVNDFWRMVWQQNTDIIIMLTNVFEDGKKMCKQYWPDEALDVYGSLGVEVIHEESFADFTINDLRITKAGKARIVKHFQFTAWSDRSAPHYSSSLVHFRHKMRAAEKLDTGPVIVHCSAGVGRTGTFIALDYLIRQGEAECEVDIFSCVDDLRTQRINMVQTYEQYIFLHDAAVEALCCKSSTVPRSEFKKVYQELDVLKKKARMTPLTSEFMKLEGIHKNMSDVTYNAGKESANKSKNRYNNILAADGQRPLLTTPVPGCNDYINAVYLPSLRKKRHYLATQLPLAHTIIDFWRMVFEQRVSNIVVLYDINHLRESDKFWPETDYISHGPVTVRMISMNSDQTTACDVFTLTVSFKNKKDEQSVKLYRTKFWPEGSGVPEDPMPIINLVEEVQYANRQAQADAKIVVTCLDGAEKCGMFCTLSVVLERIKAEQEVAIGQVIKQLRSTRQQIIPNMDQFRFCYDAVMTYLKATEL